MHVRGNLFFYTILHDYKIIRLYIQMQQLNAQMKITWPNKDSWRRLAILRMTGGLRGHNPEGDNLMSVYTMANFYKLILPFEDKTSK